MNRWDLPDEFVENVRGAFPGGAAWLKDLPSLLEECKRRWHLEVAGPAFPLSFNYAVPVHRADGVSAVLKLSVPCDESRSEMRAMRAFGGVGAARLLDCDEERGAMLLERISPGHTLATLGDERRATEIAAQTMLQLWKASAKPGEFRTLADWTSGLSRLRAGFSGGTGLIDADLVDAAERVRSELLTGSADPVLAHGDLHHLNILQGENGGWLAIDPKGVLAERAYEPAAYLLNPDPPTCLNEELQKARIAIFADALGLDARRVLGWAFFQSVLSAWWTVENGGEVRGSQIGKARLLRSLMR
jgi:streptomycin 6-kinase